MGKGKTMGKSRLWASEKTMGKSRFRTNQGKTMGKSRFWAREKHNVKVKALGKGKTTGKLSVRPLPPIFPFFFRCPEP